MVVAVPAATVEAALAAAAAAGIGAYVAGEIVPAADLGGTRYGEVEQ